MVVLRERCRREVGPQDGKERRDDDAFRNRKAHDNHLSCGHPSRQSPTALTAKTCRLPGRSAQHPSRRRLPHRLREQLVCPAIRVRQDTGMARLSSHVRSARESRCASRVNLWYFGAVKVTSGGKNLRLVGKISHSVVGGHQAPGPTLASWPSSPATARAHARVSCLPVRQQRSPRRFAV